MKQYRIYCLLGLLGWSVSMFSQEQDSARFFSVKFSPTVTSIWLQDELLGWQDSIATVGMEEAMTKEFLPLAEMDTLRPGAAFWGRLLLENPEADSMTWILSFGTADTLELFVRQGDSWKAIQNGTAITVSKRETLFGPYAAWKLEVAAGERVEFMFRSREIFRLPPKAQVRVYSEVGYSLAKAATLKSQVFFVAIFQAIFLIMLLYNLMIFVTTRQITYFWYALYLFALFGSLYFDITARFLPQIGFDSPWINKLVAGVMLCSTSLWYFLFGRSFLNIPKITPAWDKGFVGLVSLRVLFLLLLTYVQAFQIEAINVILVNQILLGIEILFLVAYFFRLAKVGGALVWFFIAGSAVVFIFGFLQLLLRDLIPFNTFPLFMGAIIVEILIFSLGLGYRMRKSQQDKLEAERSLNQELSKINTAFGRFVPHEFLESLGRKDVMEVALGDQVEREVTVLFSDIRSYTTLSEQMTPKENFDFLNGYLGRVGPIIQENGGFVNQYYGDGIMALFMGKAEEAVAAAISIQQAVASYNLERIAKDRLPIKIGIGIHSGSLMMGVIGDTLRMDAGVVSDSVNTAARMEGLTKQFGVNILLSETTASQLPETVQLRSLGKVLVKGRKAPIGIYDCYGGDPPEIIQAKFTTASRHEEALRFYLGKSFVPALRIWDELREDCPDDQVLIRFQAMCKQCLLEGVPDDWAGVEEMQEK